MKTSLTTAALLVGTLALAGCGETPQFDPSTKYTAESLAQELSFRYRDLKPSAKAAAAKPVQVRRDRDAESKSLGDEAGKQAPAETLDDLLAETAAKMSLIQGMSRPDVCKAMIETLAKDNALRTSEKELLKAKLQQLAQGS